MIGSFGLTEARGPAAAAQEMATVPGMAHFAHTGPEDTSCRQCALWGSSSRFKRDEGGVLKPRRCNKFARLAYGALGAGVPADTPSCRHFTPREGAPDLIRKREERQ